MTLEHTVEQDDRTVIVERQDVIYRQAGGVTPPAGPAATLPPPPGWRETVVPTTTLLFRFSAVTFNGHRIHYDHDYATRSEHYPDLVVHGPLTAMLLAQSASRHLGKPAAVVRLPGLEPAVRRSTPVPWMGSSPPARTAIRRR